MKTVSAYRQMRMIIMYDLPTTSHFDTKNAQKFHNFLLNQGYIMLQFSVYMKLCQNYDSVAVQVKKVKQNLPQKGNIRLLTITEKQYQHMEILVGETSLDEQYASTDYIIEL